MFSNRTVLFYFDLMSGISWPGDLPSSIVIERKLNEAEISQSDLQEFINFWNPQIARQELEDRFNKNASLWMIKVDGNLAGYGWTLRGRTIEPHFLFLGQDDVHLFDYYIAPPYRGRGLNPMLVNQILRKLSTERPGRTFIEVAEWNHAQLSSLRKTPFRRLGSARKLTIRGRTVVCRDADRAPGQKVGNATDKPSAAANSGKSTSTPNLPV
jgi:hypothetical protein